ncbi:nucleotidyl transferase AbiEii/AbiGii toxin family protein [Amycolatopsis cihanbeyliensis]|uniref:Nucleotidyltransferase AbiEii toxin of type IV toxin-antitoxin system n=1 Tax=Amycolatopsis cihanbeyliensis TaxID=1128664 RepID=A0A542DGU1_AMYCI|nr:nucleotidyl transferase AbiEii/AbiGii toxin family protein [Amycolatopsis cihanbeyliensis]TQJ02286.1 nucleotidyltransferase AbiEii toxin of type IV toxin-antitoxin system [Amycolatopsis cihanbeyliensis]
MTRKPPLSPHAFTSSLKARAANTSKVTGVPTGELLERYYHRRLLARVFHADPDKWVLKGGQALLVRWPRARYSTDVDLLRTVDEATIDETVSALIAAVSTDLDDDLRFDHHDTSRETAADRPSRKVRFKVMFGLRQLSTVSVDVVVTGLQPRGELLVEPLDPPFSVDSGPWPTVRMWPLEDHVADKIAAMYERHGARLLPSTRFKDLVDLVLIANKSSLSGTVTHAALHAEVHRRQAAGTQLVLPETFVVPSPVWPAGYRAEAAKAHELPMPFRTMDGATPLADAFISPLLRQHGPAGRWQCERREWC